MTAVIMLSCSSHPQRPDAGCTRCQTAVDGNRSNKHWAHTYYPWGQSWFGKDAFILPPGLTYDRRNNAIRR